ncbi:MAG: S1 RNA-binding domain-containing protein [Synechococcales bacterium]|nr:S1 RNA-binding domain-containing protein [Cyanobacteria bacterium REEB444]MEB3125495.1 S1 RNA-binding domain-containing protein [Synechococcales bacterium]
MSSEVRKKHPDSLNSSDIFSTEDFAKALEQQDCSFQVGQVVNGKVFEHDNNGAYVDIGGKAAAFIPIQETMLRTGATLGDTLPLGSERQFLIIRGEDAEGQVMLSIRRLELQKLWEELAVIQGNGKSLDVRVTGVNKGGVNVDFQGLRGFIPRSHLLQKENLDSLKGLLLTVNVLETNSKANKLVFSQRQASQSARIRQFEVGQLVEGQVSDVKSFGLFVDLGGVTSLLHIHQISKKYINSLPSLFQTGQTIKAIIIELDELKGRISLSTKILENYPGEALEKMDGLMADAEARLEKAIQKLTQSSKEDP